MPEYQVVRATREIVQKYHLNVTRKLGQNFLTDEDVLDAIVEASGITPQDSVLEIGPGIGTLTECLAAAARHVIAVEIDKGLIPVLGETLSHCGNVTVLHQDILKTDIPALQKEYNGGEPFHVVANLPYYITTPILMMLLEAKEKPVSVTVMVQKEMALRMCASPGGKDYGALTIAVQYYAVPEIVRAVPGSAFFPPPKVESAVLHLHPLEKPPVRVADEDFFFRLVRAAFGKRRKTLVNSVSSDASLGVSKERVTKALQSLALSASVRGEVLSMAQFAAVSDLLGQE